MKKLVLVLGFLAVFVSGCAWQRIPAAPEYARESPIPIKVGVEVESKDAQFANQCVDELKTMRLFDGLIYPYREGDAVDAVMRLSAQGKVEGHGAAKGFLIGLSFFTLSPFIGPDIAIESDVNAAMSSPDKREVAHYKAHARTESEFGLAANAAEVGKKTGEVQVKRLADELGKQIRADRVRLLERIRAARDPAR